MESIPNPEVPKYAAEEMFSDYLKARRMDPRKMKPSHLRFTKNGFYGGLNMIMHLQMTVLGDLPIEEAKLIFLEICKEVDQYWEQSHGGTTSVPQK